MTKLNPLQSENNSTALFPTAYFPPIAYFALVKRCNEVAIEACEHFVKQTIRNRAYILSANGVLPMVVPVRRNKQERLPIERLEIDYTTPWQQNHLRAIRSAYGKTPYFEYYFPYFEDTLLSAPKYLLELNTRLTKQLSDFLQIKTKLSNTQQYVKNAPMDFRSLFTKQNLFTDFKTPNYFQAFSNKFPFVQNLSALDLIFNMGGESGQYLRVLEE